MVCAHDVIVIVIIIVITIIIVLILIVTITIVTIITMTTKSYHDVMLWGLSTIACLHQRSTYLKLRQHCHPGH